MTIAMEHEDRFPNKPPRKTLQEILAEVDSKPMSSADFETPGAFDGDDELEEFLALVREMRSQDLA